MTDIRFSPAHFAELGTAATVQQDPAGDHRFAYVMDCAIGATGESAEAALAAMRAIGPCEGLSLENVAPITPRLARWLSTRGTPRSWETCEDGITIDLTDEDARAEVVDRFADDVRSMHEIELRDMLVGRQLTVSFLAHRDDDDAHWEYEIGFGINGTNASYPYDGDREALIASVRADARDTFDIDIECSLR